MPTPSPVHIPFVLTSPGYLAGGGDWEHLTELLKRGHGWRDVSTIDQHTALTSPDGRMHVVLDRRAGWTWTLRATTAHGHQWAARLGAHLPVEYVMSMADALLRPTHRQADVLAPLHAAGWSTDATAVSPDGLVCFTEEHVHGIGSGPWHAACTVGGYTWWTATFSTHTPSGVIAALTSSLASDTPLPRMAIGTPLFGCGQYTRLARTSYGVDDVTAGVEAQISEARAERRHAAAPSPPSAVRTRAPRRR
ncbi:DUF317 domain-containing protein [Streptomyces sp. ATCC 21386]|uniref:DUF317 domain-containing protein n=1 Tax=Streptomyces sp. ATCC 21386 TaxID=2699428 RepID=UPI001BFFC6FD|nr:DUF317 domain-containing protein [Streptomyces sp. ATCC 21386]